MRIVCPSCQAAYEVPDAVLRPAAPGSPARLVKCAKCGNAWAPATQVSAPEPHLTPLRPEVAQPTPPALPPPEEDLPPPSPVSPPPPPAPDPAPRKPEPAPVARVTAPRAAEKLTPPDPPSESARGPGLVVTILAWATSLALLAGLGWAVVIWRGAIMSAWAPSRRFFDLLGLM